jgi:hypothetical protein
VDSMLNFGGHFKTPSQNSNEMSIGRNWEIRMDPLGGGTPGPIVERKYGGSGTRVDND